LSVFIFSANDLFIDRESSINKNIMNFLSIDCSTDLGSLFLKSKNKTFTQVLQSDKSNNDTLMLQILNFFKDNNLNFSDISEVFVNQGPGNFSGLRGSLSTAKGISLSMNLNLSGYDTFTWSCAKFFNKEDSFFSIIKFREKYFIRKFNKNLRSISKVKEITEDKIIRTHGKQFIVIPRNMSKYFSKRLLKLDNLITEDLDHNQLEFLYLKGLLDKDFIKPLYLI